jgi:predicted acyltransferase
MTPQTPAVERIQSIDALRGFDMFWIIGGDALFRAIGKWSGGYWGGMCCEQLEHVEWAGFHFYDLIFPLFLFLVGTVIPFSLESARRRGATTGGVYFRIVRRTVALFALAMIYNGVLRLDWLVQSADGHWTVNVHDHLRITGVLQRIAVCYGIAAVITLHTRPRGRLLVIAAILLGYWAILTFVPNPETGIAGDLSKEGNLGGYLDRAYLPGRILPKYYGYGDNEGLLSTIPAVATVLLGTLAGRWLALNVEPGWKMLGLAVAGIVSLALGEVWGLTFPVIKNLWTSSFVLVTAGWSLLLLSLFYGVIDVLRWRAWAFFFVVIGANAITIYVGQQIIPFAAIAKYFFGGVDKFAGELAPVLAAASVLLVKWVFLLILYRQKLFLRV